MKSSRTAEPIRIASTVALWVITVLDAGALGIAGSSKFSNPEVWTAMFQEWGYPAWFAFVVGAAECALALALLFPRVAFYAAAGLGVIMLGALGTLLSHPGGRMGLTTPVVHLLVLTIILLARRGGRWRLPGPHARQEAHEVMSVSPNL